LETSLVSWRMEHAMKTGRCKVEKPLALGQP